MSPNCCGVDFGVVVGLEVPSDCVWSCVVTGVGELFSDLGYQVDDVLGRRCWVVVGFTCFVRERCFAFVFVSFHEF